MSERNLGCRWVGRMALEEHITVMLVLICLRQLGGSPGLPSGRTGFVGGVYLHVTYIHFNTAPAAPLLSLTYVQGAPHMFLGRREGGVFHFSLVFTSSRHVNIFYLIGFLQEEGESMICHQPYIMDKETKGEWLDG